MNDISLKTPLASYTGYKGLPPLVNLHTIPEAIAKGLTVDEAVARMKYIHWALRRLHGIFIARLTAMPIYELKMVFSLHAHYCIEHVEGIFSRVREMRHPPYGMDVSPHPAMDFFFDEILSAPDTEALVIGLYEKAIPGVLNAIRAQLEVTNRLHEHPTFRKLRFLLLEMEDIEVYGRKALECLVSKEARQKHSQWAELLDEAICAFGTFTGTVQPRGDSSLQPQYSASPFVYDGRPQRDERFQDCYNMGVNAESFLHNPSYPARAKTLMLYFKRLREIDVPEMMASIITQTSGQPVGYYVHMTRQLWDEARHAMMGEVGLLHSGIDWTQIPINFTWSLELNTRLKPEERHAILFFIEQGLMPKETGKEMEWEVAVASEDSVSRLIQDYDWADEILHAKIGRDWFVKGFGGQEKAMQFGSQCWDKVLQLVPRYKDEGLTEHRNWWPEVYTAACKHWGMTPDPHVLAFDENYAGKRPDLQTVQS